MKKLIFFSALAAILAMACEPKLEYVYTSIVHNHYITNLTEKKIIHEIWYYQYNDTNKYDRYRLCYVSDGVINQAEFEWLVKHMKHQYQSERIDYYSCRLYSVDDTTSLLWNFLDYDGYFIFPNDYYYRISSGEIKTDSGTVWVSDYYLIVNDSIISTMQKDYSMLEKFSEYYGN